MTAASQPSITMAFAGVEDRTKYRLKKTCDWVVSTIQPFSAVENEAYRDMIRSYDVEAKPFSRKSVQECLIAKEATVRKAVIDAVNGSTVALTVDHWTSNAKHNYTGMTVHFIDKDWNLVALPLG